MKHNTARSWTRLADNDGSRRGGIDRGQWYQLTIYGFRGRYLVSIRFYAHPSKEPFQAIKECADPVAAAVFLITHDPLIVLKNCWPLALSNEEMQRVYQFQVQALLLAFEKKCRSLTGSPDRPSGQD